MSELTARVEHAQGTITGGRIEYTRRIDGLDYFHDLGAGARILLVTVPRYGRCLLLTPAVGRPLWAPERDR